jgi:hypothetical protein
MSTETFGDDNLQELNQVGSKGSPFKTNTCTSNLKIDDETVNFRVLTEKEKPDNSKEDENSKVEHPLCLQCKFLSWGSCNDGGSCPCSLQQNPGDQMDVSGLDGLNDTPLLAPLLKSDNPPLPLGGAPGKTKPGV